VAIGVQVSGTEHKDAIQTIIDHLSINPIQHSLNPNSQASRGIDLNLTVQTSNDFKFELGSEKHVNRIRTERH
jgi:hypothetical protein